MENSKSSRSTEVVAAIEACLDRHVSVRQELVVGLSGGLDSITLLHGLRGPAQRRSIKLSAVHVHHGLSPNADAWATHCRDFCAAHSIPLVVEHVVVERASFDGLEAAARRARRIVFGNLACDWIALAHHRNDQSETMLFNLLRGTGLAGASGMAEVSGKLLRPLIDVGRVDIERYAVEHGLRWIEDESNSDTGFSRNHLRHEVLARLEDRFPGSSANLAAAARRFAEARSLIDDLAVLDLGAHPNDFPLDLSVLVALPEPRARNVVRYLLQRRHIGIPSEERLREIVRQIIHAAPDRHPEATLGCWRLFRLAGKMQVEPAQEVV